MHVLLEQHRLRRHVVVPQVVVHGLEVPAHRAGGGVDGDDGAAVVVHGAALLARIVVRRGIAGGQEQQAIPGVGGHRRPHVRRAAREHGALLHLLGGDGVHAGRHRVEHPLQFAAAHVEAAHRAAGGVQALSILDEGAGGDDVAHHDGRGGGVVLGLAHIPKALQQVHLAAAAEVFAGLAGGGVHRP